jgi:hypothetical protein
MSQHAGALQHTAWLSSGFLFGCIHVHICSEVLNLLGKQYCASNIYIYSVLYIQYWEYNRKPKGAKKDVDRNRKEHTPGQAEENGKSEMPKVVLRARVQTGEMSATVLPRL